MHTPQTWLTLALALVLGAACGPSSSGDGSGSDAGAAPDTGPPPCEWPTENMGVAKNQYLSSNLAWQGFGPGETEERSISIEEFYDCHRAKGIHAVLLITSQYSCGRCASQASGLTEKIAEWADEGLNIQVLTLKIEDPTDITPASMEGVNRWRDEHGLTTSYLAYDNSYTMVPREAGGGVRFGTPINSIIDPRTMEVVEVIQTFDRSYAALLELARMRAAE
jgi:hypothetical protein